MRKLYVDGYFFGNKIFFDKEKPYLTVFEQAPTIDILNEQKENFIKEYVNKLSLIKEKLNFEEVVVFFEDNIKTSFRQKLDKKYVTYSDCIPYQSWINDVIIELEKVNIKFIVSKKFEYMDYMATFIFSKEKGEKIIFTENFDFLQLINEEIKVWIFEPETTKTLKEKFNVKTKLPVGCFEFNEEIFIKHYNCKPKDYPLFKTLNGLMINSDITSFNMSLEMLIPFNNEDNPKKIIENSKFRDTLNDILEKKDITNFNNFFLSNHLLKNIKL